MTTKNYHTHTYRCKHAVGDVDEYCRAALEQGLTIDAVRLTDGRYVDVGTPEDLQRVRAGEALGHA